MSEGESSAGDVATGGALDSLGSDTIASLESIAVNAPSTEFYDNGQGDMPYISYLASADSITDNADALEGVTTYINEHRQARASPEYADGTSVRPKYAEMALYQERDKGVTEGDIEELEEMIEQGIKYGHIQESDITRNPGKVKDTMDYLQNLLTEFYANPSKYTALKGYLAHHGYTIRDPTLTGVYDDTPNAVARTNTKDTLEANIHFYESISRFAEEHNLSHEAAEEMVLTHELIHLAQPESVLKSRPAPATYELDVELRLTEYFGLKSLVADNEGERTKYESMAKAAYARAQAWSHALQNGGKLPTVSTRYAKKATTSYSQGTRLDAPPIPVAAFDFAKASSPVFSSISNRPGTLESLLRN